MMVRDVDFFTSLGLLSISGPDYTSAVDQILHSCIAGIERERFNGIWLRDDDAAKKRRIFTAFVYLMIETLLIIHRDRLSSSNL